MSIMAIFILCGSGSLESELVAYLGGCPVDLHLAFEEYYRGAISFMPAARRARAARSTEEAREWTPKVMRTIPSTA